jgi:tryptophan synthase alpha chain
MSKIKEKIEQINKADNKALTIFLTSGFPNPKDFLEVSEAAIDSGADLLEIGIPFGDSLADGPVIQSSYLDAIGYKIGIKETFKFVQQIRLKSEIPIILMSSSNPIYKYGLRKFLNEAESCGVDGLILPDVPLEEYDDFFEDSHSSIDNILLTTPTSSEKRIKQIDNLSRGFLYCVSIAGTTGSKTKFEKLILQNLERTYKIIKNNKMLIGFGISTPDDIKNIKQYCDGVIVGSAVIKKLLDGASVKAISNFVKELKEACN